MGGRSLLFENVKGSSFPVAVNLLSTIESVVWSMRFEKQEQMEYLKKLALMQQCRPPKVFKERNLRSVVWHLLKARLDIDLLPPCHQKVIGENDLDLKVLPILCPWPEYGGWANTLDLIKIKASKTGMQNIGV